MAPLGGAQAALQAGQLHTGGIYGRGRHSGPPLALLGQILLDQLRLDALELRGGQDRQQLPAQVQCLLDGAVLLCSLGNIALFKLVRELGIQQVGRAEAASPRMDISSLFSLPVA